MSARNRFAEALAVQDACNVSGVARSLVETIDDARKNPIAGFEGAQRDPAVRLFVYKLASLCDADYASFECVTEAWSDCVRLSAERAGGR